jgi:hypothetical protein
MFTVRAYLVPASLVGRLNDATTFWDTLHSNATLIAEFPHEYYEPLAFLFEYARTSTGSLGSSGWPRDSPCGVYVHVWATAQGIQVFESRLNKRRINYLQDDSLDAEWCRFIVGQKERLGRDDRLLIVCVDHSEHEE